MAEDEQEGNLEFVGAVFETAHHGRVHDIAGGSYHEEVTKTAVEDQLGRHAGIDTREDRGERSLALGDFRTPLR